MKEYEIYLIGRGVINACVQEDETDLWAKLTDALQNNYFLETKDSRGHKRYVNPHGVAYIREIWR